MKLNAQQLRTLEVKKAQVDFRNIKRNPVYFILENIYDTYNIGGLFRLADAITVEKIYLCGEMEIPPNHKIKKASIGTYKIVPWEYFKSAPEAIADLNSKFKVQSSPLLPPKVGYEGQAKLHFNNKKVQNFIPKVSPDVIPAQAGIQKNSRNEAMKQWNFKKLNIIAVEQHKSAIAYTNAKYSLPVALIFGNETYGITPETLALADQIVEIPMWGINKSLNVIVSAAIVSYWIMNTASNSKE